MRAEEPRREVEFHHNPNFCRWREDEILADSTERLVHLQQVPNEEGTRKHAAPLFEANGSMIASVGKLCHRWRSRRVLGSMHAIEHLGPSWLIVH